MDSHRTLFERLSDCGIQISDAQKELIINKVSDILTYTPTIGIFGKTGAGKSSLCNALFGTDLFEINDVQACTRNLQRELLKISQNSSIRLIDVPGAGESTERDREYAKLYLDLLPELDAVIWVIKADDRALTSDENFYKNILLPHINNGLPFLIVINQVDKIMPIREWDYDAHEPGANQLLNIERKKRDVQKFFGVPYSKVVAVSAYEKYNLLDLVSELTSSLPSHKRVGTYINFSEDLQNEQMDNFVRESTEHSLTDVITDVLGPVDAIDTIIRIVKDPEVWKPIWEGVKKAGKLVIKGVKLLARILMKG